MEGVPDRLKPWLFTRPWRRRSRPLHSLPNRRIQKVGPFDEGRSTRERNEAATGTSEVDRIAHRGTENAHARHLDDERRGHVPDDDSPKRGRNAVKRSLPRSSLRTPKRLENPHDESRGASRERASTGARKSFEWQTSVERIACLFRGEVERPRNGSKGTSQKEAPQRG